MLLLRAAILTALVCLHVIGGAILFRKLLPRESPWWGFFLPELGIISLLNFVEHMVALPLLVIFLPFTIGGSILLLFFSRGLWESLRLPAAMFAVTFCFCLWIKSLQPDVNFYNTEGLTDLARVLDFCLGDTVPPQDCWLPPFPHTGYYTFMHYGASVLKRLLYLDIGTAYNVSSALMSTLSLLACAAAAFTLGRFRPAIALLALVIMAGGFTGATPIRILFHPTNPSPSLSIDIGDGDPEDPDHREFAPLLRLLPQMTAYRIYTPGCYIYYSEFHATMGGQFVALLSVFGVAELLRRRRAILPWIYLAVAPALAFITCTWFVFMVTFLAVPSLLLAWTVGRRPSDWRYALFGAGTWLAMLWPDVSSLLHNSSEQVFYWSWQMTNDLIPFLIQGWPLYVPWLALCFAWRKLDLTARWLHFWLLPIIVSVEIVYLTDRGTTLEKTLGGAFGISMAVLYPILFLQRGRIYRALSVLIIATGIFSLIAWTSSCCTAWHGAMLHLEGNHYLQSVPSESQMERVLDHVRGITILTGRAHHAWFKSPTLAAFTENRCYLGWTNAEETSGHAAEADAREVEINAFYDGATPDPLMFLNNANISAVVVWPEDKMSYTWLTDMKAKLGSEFTYVDCRIQSPDNAGVFLRNSLLERVRGASLKR